MRQTVGREGDKLHIQELLVRLPYWFVDDLGLKRKLHARRQLLKNETWLDRMRKPL